MCCIISIKVYDGSNVQEPELTLMNQQHSEKSHKDLPTSLYTTGPSAVVRIDHAKLLAASKTLPINSLQLRVAKVFIRFPPFIYLNVLINSFNPKLRYRPLLVLSVWDQKLHATVPLIQSPATVPSLPRLNIHFNI